MLLSNTILDMLQNQLAHEYTNQSKYRNVQAYFSALNLEGFYKYFEEQAKGEYKHYEHIISYLDQKNAPYKINVEALEPIEFNNVNDIVDFYYNTEIGTTQLLYAIAKQAKAEGDEGTVSWLYDTTIGDTNLSLINEQVEEEDAALILKQKVLDGLGDSEQLNGQWIRQVDKMLLEQLEG